MKRVEGKVAFVSGLARGQGRAHAIRLAEEGADIVGFDICGPVGTSSSPSSTPEDMAETVAAVEALDRRIIARQADSRDAAGVRAVVEEGLSEFGHIDIVVANAGIASVGFLWEISDETWQDMIDVNLTGVWNTVKAVVPSMIERNQGGSIILTSSAAGLVPIPRLGHYTAAKHGVAGLSKSFAVELARYSIRSNSIHPGNVNTQMINNPTGYKAFTGQDGVTAEQFEAAMASMNAMPTAWADPRDISNGVLYLASDEARWVTGTQLVIDAGNILPFKIPN